MTTVTQSFNVIGTFPQGGNVYGRWSQGALLIEPKVVVFETLDDAEALAELARLRAKVTELEARPQGTTRVERDETDPSKMYVVDDVTKVRKEIT